MSRNENIPIKPYFKENPFQGIRQMCLPIDNLSSAELLRVMRSQIIHSSDSRTDITIYMNNGNVCPIVHRTLLNAKETLDSHDEEAWREYMDGFKRLLQNANRMIIRKHIPRYEEINYPHPTPAVSTAVLESARDNNARVSFYLGRRNDPLYTEWDPKLSGKFGVPREVIQEANLVDGITVRRIIPAKKR